VVLVSTRGKGGGGESIRGGFEGFGETLPKRLSRERGVGVRSRVGGGKLLSPCQIRGEKSCRWGGERSQRRGSQGRKRRGGGGGITRSMCLKKGFFKGGGGVHNRFYRKKKTGSVNRGNKKKPMCNTAIKRNNHLPESMGNLRKEGKTQKRYHIHKTLSMMD